jgi:hypothetical protein
MRSAACAARCSALSPAKEDRNTVMAWFQTTSGASFGAVAVAASGGGCGFSAAEIGTAVRQQIAKVPTTNHNGRNRAGCVHRHKPV